MADTGLFILAFSILGFAAGLVIAAHMIAERRRRRGR